MEKKFKLGSLMQVGLLIFVIYKLWCHFVGKIADPIMFISCICMLIGIFFTSREWAMAIKNSKNN